MNLSLQAVWDFIGITEVMRECSGCDQCLVEAKDTSMARGSS